MWKIFIFVLVVMAGTVRADPFDMHPGAVWICPDGSILEGVAGHPVASLTPRMRMTTMMGKGFRLPETPEGAILASQRPESEQSDEIPAR